MENSNDTNNAKICYAYARSCYSHTRIGVWQVQNHEFRTEVMETGMCGA